jgi:hypothetical protein
MRAAQSFLISPSNLRANLDMGDHFNIEDYPTMLTGWHGYPNRLNRLS